MQLLQLINKLQSIKADESGDLDVLTRGSQPATMVVADDVRIVRLKSGRSAVYIGKPKADRT